MMAMSGSGCSAIGMASFSRSAALRFAGAEGGGAGATAGAVLAELGWPWEELPARERPSRALRMMQALGRITAARPDQRSGLSCLVVELV
jgi:hypothetical protein